MSKVQRIFIMDDDRFYAEVLKQKMEMLKLGDVKVFSLEKQFFQSLNEQPHVIVLDYFLKSYNGIEVLKRLKKSNPKARCILLSSQSSMKVAVETLKMGAFSYVEKDVKALDKIVALIRKVKYEDEVERMKKFVLWGSLFAVSCLMGIIYYWLR